MNSSRLERLLALVQARSIDGSTSVPQRICVVCRDAGAVDGAGLSLIDADTPRPVAASDDAAAVVEDLQRRAAEGPCLDAVRSASPVLEPDLTSGAARDRWPTFAPTALRFGARAVFGFPLIADRRPIGALDLYSRATGPLSRDAIDDILILADLAALALLNAEKSPTLTGVVATEPSEPWAHSAVVHHASGMTAVQLGVRVDEALLRLRAYAFASERLLVDVARDVGERRLRLDGWADDE